MSVSLKKLLSVKQDEMQFSIEFMGNNEKREYIDFGGFDRYKLIYKMESDSIFLRDNQDYEGEENYEFLMHSCSDETIYKDTVKLLSYFFSKKITIETENNNENFSYSKDVDKKDNKESNTIDKEIMFHCLNRKTYIEGVSAYANLSVLKKRYIESTLNDTFEYITGNTKKGLNKENTKKDINEKYECEKGQNKAKNNFADVSQNSFITPECTLILKDRWFKKRYLLNTIIRIKLVNNRKAIINVYSIDEAQDSVDSRCCSNIVFSPILSTIGYNDKTSTFNNLHFVIGNKISKMHFNHNISKVLLQVVPITTEDHKSVNNFKNSVFKRFMKPSNGSNYEKIIDILLKLERFYEEESNLKKKREFPKKRNNENEEHTNVFKKGKGNSNVITTHKIDIENIVKTLDYHTKTPEDIAKKMDLCKFVYTSLIDISNKEKSKLFGHLQL